MNLYFGKYLTIFFMYSAVSLIACSEQDKLVTFNSDFSNEIQRPWIGPEYWSNPLQDWQLNHGRIECIGSGGERNVFLLTYELSDKPGTLEMSVRLGNLQKAAVENQEGWVGFKIGIQGDFKDYRDNAVNGDGLRMGITAAGQLFIHNLDLSVQKIDTDFKNLQLKISANPVDDKYHLTLSVYDKKGQILSRIKHENIDAGWLQGGLALVCSSGKMVALPEIRTDIEFPPWGAKPGTERGGNIRFWFSDWKISGSKLKAYPDHAFGPILFCQYTLHRGILKLTAQMPPLGKQDIKKVDLQISTEKGKWRRAAAAIVDTVAYTATFRVEDWDGSREVPYRLVYNLAQAQAIHRTYHYNGIIRREPWDKNEIVIAGFTGNNDLGFPNNELVQAVKYHNPDILFFSGDQIYERVAGYGVQRSPVHKAILDYLRKWYLYGWAYGDLLRDRPTVAIPDDHDVYHGNIWGAGGIATPEGLSGKEAQDAGGYKMPAQWVNMVQRTQTSHLPDAYDATPVAQGIGVYYCAWNYAGLSFAIIEDRKFKSAPKVLLPQAEIQNGWAQNREFNAEKEGDVPGAILLGDRQLKFLEVWAADWSQNTWMKVVLSQTIFANVATLPRNEAYSDEIVPRLRILSAGDFPPDDIPVSDMDSNGWPQTGRNKALRIMRKAFAFHLAGDQHLGSSIQYGIDDWNDAGFAFCVPAISNVWPRRWLPSQKGKNKKEGAPRYTGEFKDGFGNKITVYAVSNPYYSGKQPSKLYDRATGYGIVRFNRNTRDITLECWPRWVDPSQTNAQQYIGWPIKINQKDNYNRTAVAHLPALNINGMATPVVQVIDEMNGEIEYTIRLTGNTFRPIVFRDGSYTIKIGEPGTEKIKTIKQIKSLSASDKKVLDISF
jgi:hypothetical protein